MGYLLTYTEKVTYDDALGLVQRFAVHHEQH
jgi:hypothetical protein